MAQLVPSAEIGVTQKDIGVKLEPKSPTSSREAQQGKQSSPTRKTESQSSQVLGEDAVTKKPEEVTGGKNQEPQFSKAGEGLGVQRQEQPKERQIEANTEDIALETGVVESLVIRVTEAVIKAKLGAAASAKEKKVYEQDLNILREPEIFRMKHGEEIYQGKYYAIAKADAWRVAEKYKTEGATECLERSKDEEKQAWVQIELDLNSRVSQGEARSIVKKAKEQSSSMGYLLGVWATKEKADQRKWQDLDSNFFGRRMSSESIAEIAKLLGADKYIDWRKKTKNAALIALVAFFGGTVTEFAKDSMPEEITGRRTA